MLVADMLVEDMNPFNLYEIVSSIFMNNVVSNGIDYDNIDVIPVKSDNGVDFIGYAYKNGKEVFKKRLKILSTGKVELID